LIIYDKRPATVQADHGGRGGPPYLSKYRISNKEFPMLKFSFPSTFPPPADSVFCGSLFSDPPAAEHLKPLNYTTANY
jgi:hypothetical protein